MAGRPNRRETAKTQADRKSRARRAQESSDAMLERGLAEFPDAYPGPEKLVALLCECMACGDFVRGRTVKALSKRWDKPAKELRKFTAEASRAIGRAVTPEDYREMICQDLEQLQQIAIDAGELSSAVNALRVRADVRGLLNPSKKGSSPAQNVPEEELDKILEDAGFTRVQVQQSQSGARH